MILSALFLVTSAAAPGDLQRRCPDPDVQGEYVCPPEPAVEEELNLDYPVEAQPDTEESRTALRLRVWLAAGAIRPFTISSAPDSYGPIIVIGKPLYEFTRHRHFQSVVDSHLGIVMALPLKQVGLTLTPMMGINWYFGQYVGLEGRAGVGFGTQLSGFNSRFGVGLAVEAAVTLRPFADDRRRFKLGVVNNANMFFDNTQSYAMGYGLSFETPL